MPQHDPELLEAINALLVKTSESQATLTIIAETNIYVLAFIAIGFVIWVCAMVWKAIWSHFVHVWL